jgi:hypothetical protein
MVADRTCKFTKEDGTPCRAAPLQEADFCLWHDPDHSEEVAEARRLGGLRRRKEKAVSGAYDFQGLSEVGQIRRILEIAVLDTLSLENSVARSRTLAYLAQVALKTLEVGEFQDRADQQEDSVNRDPGGPPPKRKWCAAGIG